VERAFGAVEPTVAIEARPEALERRPERRRDGIERRRVPGLVGAHLVHVGAGKIPARRPAERHDLKDARVRLQHRAQRHAERRFARLVEPLLAPADLDMACLAEGKPRQPLHQVGALDDDP
jgi:hypothetical protein